MSDSLAPVRLFVELFDHNTSVMVVFEPLLRALVAAFGLRGGGSSAWDGVRLFA